MIFGRVVKAISSPGVHSPCFHSSHSFPHLIYSVKELIIFVVKLKTLNKGPVQNIGWSLLEWFGSNRNLFIWCSIDIAVVFLWPTGSNRAHFKPQPFTFNSLLKKGSPRAKLTQRKLIQPRAALGVSFSITQRDLMQKWRKFHLQEPKIAVNNSCRQQPYIRAQWKQQISGVVFEFSYSKA